MKSRVFFVALTMVVLGISSSCSHQPVQPTTTETPAVVSTATPVPPSATPTATHTLPPTATITPSPSPSPTPEPTLTLPVRAEIEGIIGSHQQYELGCEANSASQIARYLGLELSQREFQEALPLTDNPETGFVGQVEGWWGAIPPASYGVHAPPVADVLRKYGVNAEAHKNYTVQQIRHEIAAGRPVMVWVIGGVRQGRPEIYTAPDGSQVTVAAYEHTVLVIGYGPDYLSFLDANEVYQRSVKQFAESWRVLNNMAVTVAEPPFLLEPET